MMGKKIPGGVQLGICRSLKPPVASPREALLMSGRELSKGEKSRERMLMPKNSPKTAQSGTCTLKAWLPVSKAKKKLAMASTCTEMAATYLPTASVSSSFSPARMMILGSGAKLCADALAEAAPKEGEERSATP
eukprot:CAMPEP_0181487194 /NCGR_PEP_ID=MMETSP1110-20121109/47673_1 /TAXON_ID=174948 /ORGANISM="Symbiodinium sp., Strain CCMP421" /LENGTH=133 /DNA_ID=CAMNT_0023613653 /DNA_START=224 /DNA_END=625 /DNA_ORIENTATION=+